MPVQAGSENRSTPYAATRQKEIVKQRIARQGGGKSGGYRSILIFRSGERAIFVFAFAKSDKGNLTTSQLV
ncbi:MAG: type II toxin-antitoxin system RelE/ParE family toxin [Sphingomonadales bacterium]|nr:type II toxin-antitoxin system RelE/ParE family toxin [Sphingomonadales bacterium]MBK6490476.1 type II toxin-antitoxin system RelE/ParE family toxin [Sphingomonadales bacterium]MBK6719567.1 type II toxin-antitoxin system RelE/ParE family toxin [Sphingomonadales bacterium]MBK8859618.1 type II toxin-antitoxin system RelE/ParE family toxin [Sphingomonadales bacterium]